jgi:RNA polymerase sigma-70 factor, ECF subfamily
LRERSLKGREESLLVERLRAGDEEAWSLFIERYRRLIWSAIHRVNGRYGAGWDDAVMEDLFEESLFKLLRRNGRALSAWKGRCRLETWIYRIVRNVCIDHLRRESRRATVAELPEDDGQMVAGALTAAAGGRDAVDLRLSLEQAIAASLDPREAMAVRLIYFEGFTYREVASRLEMTVGALSGFVYRALEKLRRSGGLEREWQGR